MMVTDHGPADRSWIVSIHGGGAKPIGAGVVVDAKRVLTCRHVLAGKSIEQVRVAFPWAENPFAPPIEVHGWSVADHDEADVAILRLAGALPSGVNPVRLRRPKGLDVFGRRWWAYGFSDRRGNDASGEVGTDLGYGWVRLDADSRYLVEPGFSGGGLWLSDYEAVIGLVGQRHGDGDGRCFTLHAAVNALPEEKLHDLTDKWEVQSAGSDALVAWGWSLTADPEGRRHWLPRSRGVSSDDEQGYRFTGRTEALTQIVAWLQDPVAGRQVFVVTGSPGAGKSAVLGRIVTTASAELRGALPASDRALRAPLGSVACAVHVKGKTALEVAHEVARAASAQLTDRVEDVVPGIRDVLAERGYTDFTVVVDALDEADTPADARSIVRHLLLPLAQNCADVGARILVGTRQRDDQGDLIGTFGAGRREIDLDLPQFFSVEDLAEYALATLQLRGAERPNNPYQNETAARPLAIGIATSARPNFLVAGLLARSHGLYDTVAATEEAIQRPLAEDGQVAAALSEYLSRIPDVDGISAHYLLTALAYAEAPGLPIDLWMAAVEAIIGREVSKRKLLTFANGSAANFLIESSAATASYRLFHQALNNALTAFRAAQLQDISDQAAITHRFLANANVLGWHRAAPYLRRSLGHHAAAGGVIDEALLDDLFVLHADLRRLIPLADQARTVAGKQRAALLRRTPRALDEPAPQRLALFSVTEALGGFGQSMRQSREPSPYRAVWAQVRQRADIATLEGHADWVNSVCAVRVDGRDLLASGGGDGTVRVWDPVTGEAIAVLEGHIGPVASVCAVQVGDRDLLASGGNDRTVRVWDPIAGEAVIMLEGHVGGVNSVCAVRVDGRDLLASAGDRTLRIWDPITGEAIAVLEGHADWVNSVCAVRVGGRDLLASGGGDGTVRVWDPVTGEAIAVLEGHIGPVASVCAVQVDGRDLLASGGGDRTVRVWDPITGVNRLAIPVYAWALTVCALDQGILVGLTDGLLLLSL
jgi:AAA ATPase domain/Trypsin-like peptidase domain/WD domain, G-beta repeat